MSDTVQVVVQADDQASSVFGRIKQSISGMTQSAMGFAAGGILRDAISGMVSDVEELGSAAYNSVANYQQLKMTLTDLVGVEIMNTSSTSQMVQVGTAHAAMTAKQSAEVLKLTDTIKSDTATRDVLKAKMQEEQQKIIQLTAKWGENGLTVKTNKAELEKMQVTYDGLNDKIAANQAKIGSLESTNSKLVTTMKAVSTGQMSLSDAMAQAGPRVQELLQWEQKLSILSPYHEDTITGTLRQAMAFGMTSEKAQDLTKSLIDYAAGTGMSESKTQQLSYAMNEVYSMGKLQSQQFRMLTRDGLSATVMANALGMNVTQLRDAMKNGSITADQFITAFNKMSASDFPDAAKKMATNLRGLQSTFENLSTWIYRHLFTGLFEAFQPEIQKIINFLTSDQFFSALDAEGSKLTAFGKQAASMIDAIITGAAEVIGFLSDLSKDAGDTGVVMDDLRETFYNLFGPNTTNLLMTFIQVFLDGWQSIYTLTTSLWPEIQSIITTDMQQTWAVIQSVLSIIVKFWRDNHQEIEADVQNAYNQIVSIVKTILPIVQQIVTAVFGNIQTFIHMHGGDIESFLRSTWQQIYQIILIALQLIQAIVVPMLTFLRDFIKSHGDEIQMILSLAWDAIKELIRITLNLIQAILKIALDIIQGNWTQAWTDAKNFADSIWNEIKNLIHDILAIIVTVVGQQLQAVYRWFVTTLENISHLLRQAQVDMHNAGVALIQGLMDGIGSMAHALWSKVNGVVQGAIDAAKRALNINSPSKVFMSIGMSMGEGMTLGLQQSAGMVAGGGAGIAAAAVAGATYTTSNNYYLSANYPYQSPRSLADDVRMLQMLGSNV